MRSANLAAKHAEFMLTFWRVYIAVYICSAYASDGWKCYVVCCADVTGFLHILMCVCLFVVVCDLPRSRVQREMRMRNKKSHKALDRVYA